MAHGHDSMSKLSTNYDNMKASFHVVNTALASEAKLIEAIYNQFEFIETVIEEASDTLLSNTEKFQEIGTITQEWSRRLGKITASLTHHRSKPRQNPGLLGIRPHIKKPFPAVDWLTG